MRFQLTDDEMVIIWALTQEKGAQWLSAWHETKGPRVRASPVSLRYVLEQENWP